MVALSSLDPRYLRAAAPSGQPGSASLRSTGALSVLATRPAAGSPHALGQFLLCPPDAALPGRRLLRVFDPADELIAGERRDVGPGGQHVGGSAQRIPQIGGKPVHLHDALWHLGDAHAGTLASRGQGRPATPLVTGYSCGQFVPAGTLASATPVDNSRRETRAEQRRHPRVRRAVATVGSHESGTGGGGRTDPGLA